MPMYSCAQYEKQFKLLELLEFRQERLNRKLRTQRDKNKEKGLKRKRLNNETVVFPRNYAFIKNVSPIRKIIFNLLMGVKKGDKS